jgi:inositol oxygenase
MDTKYRVYDDTKLKVKENYRLAREKQNLEFYTNMYDKYLERKKVEIDIWEVIEKLSDFIDVSDPDINLPNAFHLFQSAEAARKDMQPEWMQLICLIHDLGKIMYLFGNDVDGTSVEKQWAIVGDTFILGCKIPDTIVYPEFNNLNLDHLQYDKYGIYSQECGLDNCIVSWGHDEFLYQTLLNNEHSIPEIGLYIIRYHSLYLWHENNEYSHLENIYDKHSKKFVKIFNKYDLYSKTDDNFDINSIKEYYEKLIKKFFKNTLLKW